MYWAQSLQSNTTTMFGCFLTGLHVFYVCVCTEAEESVENENNTRVAEASNGPATGFLEHSSQFVELLSNMSSVLELLSQAAEGSLDEQERQVEQYEAKSLSMTIASTHEIDH